MSMKLDVTHENDVSPQTHYMGSTAVSGLRWSKLLSPADYRLWLSLSELEDGAVLSWNTQHGDEVLYVLEGELEVQGHRSPKEGAMVVENGVAGHATAVGTTRIAHFGTRDGYTGSKSGGYFHVGGALGRKQLVYNPHSNGTYWGDSTCAGCDLTLFKVHREPGGPDMHDYAHSHSSDEIILVLAGSILLGPRELQPMTALSVAGDVRYVQTSGPRGHTFLNFRPGPSHITWYEPGKDPLTYPEMGGRNPARDTGDMVDVPSDLFAKR